jgi:hypothetical protein
LVAKFRSSPWAIEIGNLHHSSVLPCFVVDADSFNRVPPTKQVNGDESAFAGHLESIEKLKGHRFTPGALTFDLAGMAGHFEISLEIAQKKADNTTGTSVRLRLVRILALARIGVRTGVATTNWLHWRRHKAFSSWIEDKTRSAEGRLSPRKAWISPHRNLRAIEEQ